MPTFTPPTRDVGGSDLPGKKVEYGTLEELPLWRLFSGISTAQSVALVTGGYGDSYLYLYSRAFPASGTFRPLTTEETAGAAYIYSNGVATSVGSDESATLQEAGYTVS